MRSPAALVALCLIGSPAAAETPLAQYDVARAQGWPEALAVCDLGSFLLTRPDMDAHVILARDDRSGWLMPLYGPRFMPPAVLYDADLRRVLYRLQDAGEVSRGDVASAREAAARRMLPRFSRFRASERVFLEEQRTVCRALAADVLARYPGARAQRSP